MPSASVAAIIPVFNRPRAIGEALDSVLAQTLAPAKVVVVDDGSTDDTAARVDEWIARKRPPFDARLIRQPNSGAAAARNRGVAEAPGCELLAFLDSDDLWPPDYLRRVADAFADAPDAVAACADRVSHDFTTGEVRQGNYADYVRGRRNATTIIFMDGPPGLSNTVVRARAFDQAGGFDSRWPTGQDYDLLLRISLLGRWLHVPGAPGTKRNYLEVLTGSGEPALSRKYDDRTFRRVQMLDRFIFECGGKAIVPEKFWRSHLTELWFRAGKRLSALNRPDDARFCYRRTVELRGWHLLARARLLLDGRR
jgi:glycosyltransferase involved in cell wall biosynthesis